MWLDDKAPGLVLAVVRGADAVVLDFGERAKGSGVQPDGRTLLRIGSISKTFSGHLLGSLAGHKRSLERTEMQFGVGWRLSCPSGHALYNGCTPRLR
jgi:D-alanyl-D-alanine-carboxypeptidase/D-alanyl-D-alanine-endopeptidase